MVNNSEMPVPKLDDPELTPGALTIEEAARRLSVHRNTVYRWAQEGTIPARKIGGVWRIDRNALDALLTDPGARGGDHGQE